MRLVLAPLCPEHRNAPPRQVGDFDREEIVTYTDRKMKRAALPPQKGGSLGAVAPRVGSLAQTIWLVAASPAQRAGGSGIVGG